MILTFVCANKFAIAEEEEGIPQGMELIEIENVKVLFPKGSKIRKHGNLMVVEGISSYSARRFVELEERLAELKAKDEQLKQELKQLKGVINEIKKGRGVQE